MPRCVMPRSRRRAPVEHRDQLPDLRARCPSLPTLHNTTSRTTRFISSTDSLPITFLANRKASLLTSQSQWHLSKSAIASLRASSSSKRFRTLLDRTASRLCVKWNTLTGRVDGHPSRTVTLQLAAFLRRTMRARSGRPRRSFSSAFPVRKLPFRERLCKADFWTPGAFTPGCQARHLPPYIEKLSEFKNKGVDIVATIASNDSWVMNAWGKVNGVKGDDILFLSDTKTFFSKEYGWQAGAGDRNGRWAMVFDNGKVIYAENEPSPKDVSVSAYHPVSQFWTNNRKVSGAEAVLAKL